MQLVEYAAVSRAELGASNALHVRAVYKLLSCGLSSDCAGVKIAPDEGTFAFMVASVAA
jgi:hypothetical protein